MRDNDDNEALYEPSEVAMKATSELDAAHTQCDECGTVFPSDICGEIAWGSICRQPKDHFPETLHSGEPSIASELEKE